jgi:UDP-GlcNAc:undecaprenyl-phosphate/decaprenyl-phosphate GlcNAc-1-phosphate transferase
MMFALVFAVAVAGSAGLGAVVRRVARGLGAVVPARPDRWHTQPTPTFGGVAIVTATLLVAGATIVVSGWPQAWPNAALVTAAAFVMFVVGLVDDRLQLPPLMKLLATLTVSSFLLYGLATIAGTSLPWWQTVILVIGYAGIVHAFNLLDNMDGLAGGVALIATFGLMAVFGSRLDRLLITVLVALAGGTGGFLIWNVRPARLFMGDCGSLFLGSMLAGTVLALLVRPHAAFVFDGVVLGLVLVVPLLDTSFVLVLRRLAGRGATRGGTDHLSHRLVSIGLTERMAVFVLYALGLGGAAVAWFVLRDGAPSIAMAALFIVAVLLFGTYLARIPAYDGEDFKALQKSSFAPFLRDVAFRYHALEMLMDVVLISAVFYLAYRLRFEGQQVDAFMPTFKAALPAVIGCKLLGLYVSGAYSRLWGTFSMRDLFALLRGVALGSVGSVLLAAYVYRFERFSRGVFLIDAVLLALALLVVRGSFRAMGEAATIRNPRARRTLIYGAGSAGQLLVREMRANPEWRLHPVAFLDDDATKAKRLLMGVPIRGGVETIDAVLARYRIDAVILSTAAIDRERELRVREVCAAMRVPVRRFKLEIGE